MNIIKFSILILLSISSISTFGEIYKCKNSSGNTVFQDRPCKGQVPEKLDANEKTIARQASPKADAANTKRLLKPAQPARKGGRFLWLWRPG